MKENSSNLDPPLERPIDSSLAPPDGTKVDGFFFLVHILFALCGVLFLLFGILVKPPWTPLHILSFVIGVIVVIFTLYKIVMRRSEGAEEVEMRLRIDPETRTIRFQNFPLVNHFMKQEQAKPVFDLPFSDVISIRLLKYEAKVSTASGRIYISKRMSEFPEIVERLRNMVDENRTDPEDYAQLKERGKIHTPIWAWAVLALCVVAVMGFVVWVFWVFKTMP